MIPTKAHLLRVTALLGALVPGAAQASGPGREVDQGLSDDLHRIVSIVDPKARRKAAEALASKHHDIDRLLDAMRRFGRFEEATPGTSSSMVELWVGKATEATEATRLHLYVPKSYSPDKRAPLLLAGHGTGGSGGPILRMWTHLADSLGMIVLAPSEAGANGGWAFSTRERNSALSAVRHVRLHYNIDENRIYCTGVSRGGHMAWDLALRFPDVFAAIAPMIGGPRLNLTGGQNNLRYLENVLHLPIRDLQGSRDDQYLVANLRYAFRRLGELKALDAKYIEFPDLGHSFKMDAVDWSEFFAKSRRDPRPKSVIRMMATTRETRSFWIDILQKDKSRVRVTPRIPAPSNQTSMDKKKLREFVAEAIERRTARLQVSMLSKGRFSAKAKHVRAFRLLLDRSMIEAGKPVFVRYKGRNRRLRVVVSTSVLLVEFADRFDRTFLPVASVTVR